jgi:hypothetical protein
MVKTLNPGTCAAGSGIFYVTELICKLCHAELMPGTVCEATAFSNMVPAMTGASSSAILTARKSGRNPA